MFEGKLEIDTEKCPMPWVQLEAQFPERNLNCKPRNRVAILIPYRDRDRELRYHPYSLFVKNSSWTKVLIAQNF